MKRFISFLAFATMIAFLSCKKSEQRPAPVNCVGLITDTLGTGDSAKLFVPSAFSPNNDGLNDVFKIFPRYLTAIDVKIYDQSNAVVFSTQTLGAVWAPPVSGDVYKKYYYRVQATTNSNHQIGICGDLHLANCLPANFDTRVLVFEDQFTQNGFTNPTSEVLMFGDCN